MTCTQMVDAQHRLAQHLPAQHWPAQHWPAQHWPAQHLRAERRRCRRAAPGSPARFRQGIAEPMCATGRVPVW